MKIMITGGAGFVGSHVAEYYAKKGDEVIVFDNLSRAELLDYKTSNTMYNWNYPKRYDNIELIKCDIRDVERIKEAAKDVDVIIHTAAQTAVTTSPISPKADFEINALGTFNMLEAARMSKNNLCVIYCSTNKIYGDNVNKIIAAERSKLSVPVEDGMSELVGRNKIQEAIDIRFNQAINTSRGDFLIGGNIER